MSRQRENEHPSIMKKMELSEMLHNLLQQKSILIVDDEEKIREMLEKYFSRVKCDSNIVHAGDGQEALRKIKNQEFGLIIVDIVMPKRNGLELFKEIKATASTKNIPVLIVSGNLHSKIVKQAIVLGAKHILAKPFNYDVFMERVFRALGVPM